MRAPRKLKDNPILVIGFLIAFIVGGFWSQDIKPIARHESTTPTKEVKGTQNFRRAKDLLHKEVFVDEETMYDIYCHCPYDRHKNIDWGSCGYSPRKNAERGKRLEWEHVVPAAYFGRNLACWKEGGRKNCGTKSDLFNAFEGDMHNLRPAIGELNGDRSDTLFGISVEKKKRYGSCNFFVEPGLVEPPDRVKGQVARIWLYMADKYGFELSADIRALMTQWNSTFPVTRIERTINDRIQRLQGDSNPFVR